MRAVLYEQFGGPLEVRQVPDPDPPADGVVVRVRANGICRSDWHGWRGHDPDIRLPHVPGHELAGTVEAVGRAVRRWRAGDRVTVPFASGCGGCPQCLAGHPQVCDDYFQPGFTAWGSFAELVALRYADTNLVRLPDDLDFEGSHGMPAHAYPALLDLIRAGRLDPRKLVRQTVPLEASPAELMAMDRFQGVGVTVIDRF